MIRWIPVEEPPEEDELVVVKCKSEYTSNDYVFITAKYRRDYEEPWRDFDGGDPLSDYSIVPLEYTRDLDHSAPPPNAIVITEDSVEGLPPEFHSIVKEYGRSMFATLTNAGQANATAEVLNVLVTRLPVLESGQGRDALVGLIGAFNQLNVAYLAEMGWSEERMTACRKELDAAMQTTILKSIPSILGTDGKPLKH